MSTEQITKTVTATGGPLEGKSFTVHVSTTRLDTVLDGGHYRVEGADAVWVPDAVAPVVSPTLIAKVKTTPRTKTPKPGA